MYSVAPTSMDHLRNLSNCRNIPILTHRLCLNTGFNYEDYPNFSQDVGKWLLWWGFWTPNLMLSICYVPWLLWIPSHKLPMPFFNTHSSLRAAALTVRYSSTTSIFVLKLSLKLWKLGPMDKQCRNMSNCKGPVVYGNDKALGPQSHFRESKDVCPYCKQYNYIYYSNSKATMTKAL